MFKIDDRTIGDCENVFIIAEGCDNHLGDLDNAMKMALNAREAGADCIKFQHHLPDEEMLPDVPMSDNFAEPLYEFLQKYALPLSHHETLKNYCDEIGIVYLCTPFSYRAACELHELGVTAFKIGSGEMTDIPSLKKISAFGLPMIISTGMSEPSEIKETYDALRGRCPLAFTNCVSEYPPVYEDINIGFIRNLKTLCPDAVIGHSDHTPDLYTCFAAVAIGAKIIEKHVILDKNQPGPDKSVSIDFQDLANLVEGIRKIEKAMGDKREVHEREKDIRRWAFRSVVSVADIPVGTIITEEMVWTKRPGTGIPSKRLSDVIGKTAKADIPKNHLISWSELT